MPDPQLVFPTQVPEAELQDTARHLRVEILDMLRRAGSGHPGGSLSALDIILTLYSGELRFDPKQPELHNRDRFVLSKGHGVPALYAVMAERGYFEKTQLKTLRQLGSPLQGHPANALLPGIEASTGSLGQGLSVAQGIALAGLLEGQGKPAWRVYALLGDGEMQEGQIWEAAMSAPVLGASNLTAILDWNKGQIDGLVSDVMPITPLREKLEAFGWHVLECDGHDIGALRAALQTAREETARPTFIIADTVKGKGVSFMESNTVGWHGRAPTDAEFEQARAELVGGGVS
jgi:transketolase